MVKYRTQLKTSQYGFTVIKIVNFVIIFNIGIQEDTI